MLFNSPPIFWESYLLLKAIIEPIYHETNIEHPRDGPKSGFWVRPEWFVNHPMHRMHATTLSKRVKKVAKQCCLAGVLYFFVQIEYILQTNTVGREKCFYILLNSPTPLVRGLEIPRPLVTLLLPKISSLALFRVKCPSKTLIPKRAAQSLRARLRMLCLQSPPP